MQTGIKTLWGSYEILTNTDCNLRCTYCFEHKKAPGVNSPELCRSFLEAMFRRDYEVRKKPLDLPPVIDLIGGESLIHPELVDSICETTDALCRRYGVKALFLVSVSTNGTTLNVPAVRKLVERWKGHFNLGFSIDGTKDVHDACRVDALGRGSYDEAVRGLRWAQGVLPPCRISVKATYTHATIDRYAEGVINLILLGFKYIAANTVFEEDWLPEEAPVIDSQLIRVADYLVEHDLVKSVFVAQINPAGIDPRKFFLPHVKTRNHCGSCTHMRCLGLHGQVYGCHRFCTMRRPVPIGYLKGGKIVINNQRLIDEVEVQWKHWPERCKRCGFSGYCASCSAAPYDQSPDDPQAYLDRRSQCGWTIATVTAREYLRLRLEERENDDKAQEVVV